MQAPSKQTVTNTHVHEERELKVVIEKIKESGSINGFANLVKILSSAKQPSPYAIH